MLDLVKISCSDVSYTTPLYTGRAKLLTLKAPIPQHGQPHSNNSSATADELFLVCFTIL